MLRMAKRVTVTCALTRLIRASTLAGVGVRATALLVVFALVLLAPGAARPGVQQSTVDPPQCSGAKNRVVRSGTTPDGTGPTLPASLRSSPAIPAGGAPGKLSYCCIHALVSETPLADREHQEAQRHADAMPRHRAEVLDQISRLEQTQDDLLDRLDRPRPAT